MPAAKPFEDTNSPSSSGPTRGRSKGKGKDKGQQPSSPENETLNPVAATPSLDGVATVNEMIATPLRDLLTGIPEAGIATNFVWLNLRDSLLKGRRGSALWDEVVDFKPSDGDELYAPENITTESITASSGNISKLVAGQINAKALKGKAFLANSAAAFTCDGFDGLFVVFNDSLAGYQPNSDSLLFLKGFGFTASETSIAVN